MKREIKDVIILIGIIGLYQNLPGNGCGGNLHNILDDGNTKSSDIDFCRNKCIEEEDLLGIFICDHMSQYGEKELDWLLQYGVEYEEALYGYESLIDFIKDFASENEYKNIMNELRHNKLEKIEIGIIKNNYYEPQPPDIIFNHDYVYYNEPQPPDIYFNDDHVYYDEPQPPDMDIVIKKPDFIKELDEMREVLQKTKRKPNENEKI